MKRKMLVLAAVLGIAIFASQAPRAEAAVQCGFRCVGLPFSTPCYCGPDTDRPGRAATCGTVKSQCYF